MWRSTATSDLLSVGLDNVTLVHVQALRCVFRLNSLALVEKPQAVWLASLSLAEGFHESFQLRDLLDFEVDLRVTVGDLQVDVGAVGWLWLWFVGHCVILMYPLDGRLLAGRLCEGGEDD